MRFRYIDIRKDIKNKGGRKKGLKASALTAHHSGVKGDLRADPIQRAKAYCKAHSYHMPYHWLIPYTNDDIIFLTQTLNESTWHNGNQKANEDTQGICLDGNFEVQKVLEIQALKLKQLLDDFQSNYFAKNGWYKELSRIKPQDNKTINTYSFGKKVHILHTHQEVRKTPTACPGKNLIPLIKEYREKKGKVLWGSTPSPKPSPTPTPSPAPQDFKALYQKEAAAHQKTAAVLRDTQAVLENLTEEVKNLKQNLESLQKEREKITESHQREIADRDAKINRYQSQVTDLEYKIRDLEENRPPSSRFCDILSQWLKKMIKGFDSRRKVK